ncbi:MAG: sulfatase-like hydrolase/transferase [Armatimonadota bacterium]
MPDRPNILIVMSDHERAEVVRPDSPCPTPHAGRVAAEGIRFDQAYTVAGHCCPARASFMTGVFPSRHGVFNNVMNPTALRRGLNPGVRTWSEILAEDGYRLSYTGKWHVSSEEGPEDRGWTPFGQVTATGYSPRRTWERPPPSRRQREQNLLKSVWAPRNGWPDVLLCGTRKGAIEDTREFQETLDGIEELKRLTQQDGPWCLYVGWGGPHDPYVIPDPWASMIDPGDVELPPSYGDDLMDRPAIYRRQKQLWDQLTPDQVKLALAHYWGYCAMLDHMFGMILDALDETGQADNTLVVRTSDHGDLVGAHGLFLKGIPPYEEAYSVPLIVRWPAGIRQPGRVSSSIVQLMDLAPTLCEAAGAPPLDPCDAQSLLPIFTSQEPDGARQELYCQMNGVELYYTQRIMRVGRYKYVFNGFDFDELYDLEADPHERRNLINEPKLESVRRMLLERLWDWARKTDDFIDNPSPTVGLIPLGPNPELRR